MPWSAGGAGTWQAEPNSQPQDARCEEFATGGDRGEHRPYCQQRSQRPHGERRGKRTS